MNKLIVLIGAFNEEKTISDVIDHYKGFADHICIIDPGSIDKTVDIAMSKNCHIIKVNEDFFDFKGRIMKAGNFLVQAKICTKNDYFIYVNCSEFFSSKLQTNIRKYIEKNPPAISIYRQSFTFGEKTHSRKAAYYLDMLTKSKNYFRVFRLSSFNESKSFIHREFTIHDELVKKAKYISITDGYIKHYRGGGLDDFEKKHQLYSDKEAQELYKKSKRATFIKMFIIPLLIFLYFLPQSLFSKKKFIVHLYHAFYKFQVQAKLFMLNTRNK
jgi:hypothetical protein